MKHNRFYFSRSRYWWSELTKEERKKYIDEALQMFAHL